MEKTNTAWPSLSGAVRESGIIDQMLASTWQAIGISRHAFDRGRPGPCRAGVRTCPFRRAAAGGLSDTVSLEDAAKMSGLHLRQSRNFQRLSPERPEGEPYRAPWEPGGCRRSGPQPVRRVQVRSDPLRPVPRGGARAPAYHCARDRSWSDGHAHAPRSRTRRQLAEDAPLRPVRSPGLLSDAAVSLTGQQIVVCGVAPL